MKKNLLLKRLFLVTISAILFSYINVQSQVKEVTFFADADVTLASGSGQTLGDFKSRNFGADGSLEMCNFDDNESLMSYFEGWIKFDLNSLPDSIPEGHGVLFAEIKFRVAGNAGPQGYNAYHLFNADDWTEGNGNANNLSTEGGLTWDDAQAYEYENEDNYAFITSNADPGGTSARPTFNITQPVLYELGENGNKILTVRMAPYYDEYDESDPAKDKKWLGLYTRNSTWDRPEGAEINPYCAQITFWIGPEQPTTFSDKGDFGDINNYLTSPDKFGYWVVGEDEGDTRLKLDSRPAPIDGTPGGLAIYDLDTFDNFNLSVKAKSAYFAETDKADFAIIFGYQDPYNYSYAYFIGNDDGGLYNVKDSVGTLISAQATPAITDTMYHNYNVVRTGNSVTVNIDGTEYITFEDEALGSEGKIGLASYNDVAIFDDFLEGELETDFTELLATISTAESIIDTATVGTENGQYSQEVVDALQDSIDIAQAVADNTGADQATVDDANDMLLASIDAFIKGANGLYLVELAALVEATEAKIDTSVAGTDAGQYPQDAITAFQEAIDSAKVMLTATDVTQDDIDAVVTYLEDAEDTFNSQLITTGVRDYVNAGFNMYPNPSKGRLIIETETDMNKITIVNVLGQTVLTKENIHTTKIDLDISDMNTGIYFVTCHQINGNKSISRLIKK